MKITSGHYALCFLSFALFLFSCKPAAPAQDEKINSIPTANKPEYPSLGNQEITALYAAADKLDMIFYDLPISVNQDDAASAKNSVLYISPAPATINNSCKALGRMSWISDGAIIKEADIYVDSLCKYFIFMENNKPAAANAMSDSGVKFFTNVITQVQQRQ